MAAVAEPLVETVLGDKWAEVADLLPILALAMALMTLQILFAPITNALGKPGLALRVSIAGSVALPGAFFVGVNWGETGLAWAWVAGMSLLLLITARLSLPVIGTTAVCIFNAAAPVLIASTGMTLLVVGMQSLLPLVDAPSKLIVLMVSGGAAYVGLLAAVAPARLEEAWSILRGRH